jgi:carbonic anhydrase
MILNRYSLIVVLFCFFIATACNEQNAREISLSNNAQVRRSPAGTDPLPFPASPDEAIKRILEGNSRFAHNEAIGAALFTGQNVKKMQKPFLAVVGCSDNPLPDEVIFDQGPGAIYVVRTAGQVISESAVGSLEFAAAELGIKAIVVLGHERCQALQHRHRVSTSPGHMAQEDLRYLTSFNDPEKAIKSNVVYQMRKLRSSSKVMATAAGRGSIRVIGGFYHHQSQKVKILNEASNIWQ